MRPREKGSLHLQRSPVGPQASPIQSFPGRREAPGGICLLVLFSLLWLNAPAVRAECTSITVSTTQIAFGAYDTLNNAPTDSVGTVMVTCDDADLLDTVVIEVRLSASQNTSLPTRKMVGGNHALVYNLFLDPQRQVVWGDGTSGSMVQTLALPLAVLPISQTLTIFGRLEERQPVPPGEYTDSIVLTIMY